MTFFSEAMVFADQLIAWHWLALGVVLLVLEIATPTNYLLWPGVAALLVGTLKFLFPGLDGIFSIFLFGVLAVASTLVWQRSRFGRAAKETPNNLNARMETYLGRKGAAAGDFAGGRGAILLDDTRWSAEVVDGSEPKQGDMLQVTGADGTVLRVRASV